jgi:hypothetical protein
MNQPCRSSSNAVISCAGVRAPASPGHSGSQLRPSLDARSESKAGATRVAGQGELLDRLAVLGEQADVEALASQIQASVRHEDGLLALPGRRRAPGRLSAHRGERWCR